jgi:hypothetical protein
MHGMPRSFAWEGWPLPSYAELKQRAEEFGYSVGGVLALAPDNDPYAAGRGRRARAAHWFAKVWETFEIPRGWHLRRIHYLPVSRPRVVPWPDGHAYVNTLKDWRDLCYAARDAVALSLVPPDILSDARNDAPHISSEVAYAPSVETTIGVVNYDPWHRPPQLQFLSQLDIGPTVLRPFQIEIWAEKTTVNDVLMPLARTYGLNVVTASGEISATACRQLVDRAVANQKPVRVLYVSDFDPAGRSIPVAMARKVEYEIDRRGEDLDIQVRPVVLTHEQCIRYSLPRAPIKETERRLRQFEEQFDEGATELDALEALYPGVLREILIREIRRYWNPDHGELVDQAYEDFKAEIDDANAEVTTEFKDELDALDEELRRVRGTFDGLNRTARELFARMRERLQKREDELVFEPPEIEFEADEDPDALFDSRRDYLEQLAAYKRFQGKIPTVSNGEDEDP